MTNIGTDQDDVPNTAEVEQETEQENECGLAICANVIGVESQIGAAAVTNAGSLLEDGVVNSAEVEQETEQENECGLAICANVIGVQSQIGAAAVTNIGTCRMITLTVLKLNKKQNKKTNVDLQFALT